MFSFGCIESVSLSKFDHFADALDALESKGRKRTLVPRTQHGIRLEQAGQTLINFGSNDYLGLANRATPAQVADVESGSGARGSGARGSGASALVCGWTQDHHRLADAIATLEATESAVVFPTGFAACVGAVATLPGEDDLILSDQLNHASLIDGCRCSAATCIVYPHRDVDQVARLLCEKRSAYQRIWIVTDGVFSMEGHVAPLNQLCDLADQHDAVMMVDEAHGTGIFGKTGSGICEALGVKDRVPLRIGTLSKAIGCQGGFVAGPSVVMDYLINRCRSLIYSTSLAPTTVTAALDSIDCIEKEPHRRDRVRMLSRRLREALGLPVHGIESEVPIIPWIIGDERSAVERSAQLFRQGFYVPAIRPPTVPNGTARLRISLSADHTDDMVDQLIECLKA